MSYSFYHRPYVRDEKDCVVYELDDLQAEFIETILGQLSDGYWENSPRMEKYWKNMRLTRTLSETNNRPTLIIDIKSMGEKLEAPFRTKGLMLAWFREKIEFLMRVEKKDRKDHPDNWDPEYLVAVNTTVSRYCSGHYGPERTFDEIRQILDKEF